MKIPLIVDNRMLLSTLRQILFSSPDLLMLSGNTVGQDPPFLFC